MYKKFNKNTDIIYIAAPAGSKKVRNLVDQTIKKLEEFGYKSHLPDDLFDEKTFFHSNTDTYRLNHLWNLLSDPQVKIIWCFTGGYGSAKLIDKLMLLPQPNQEKLFIGFSDITALHLFLNQHWHWNTIHGAVLHQINIPSDEINPNNILQIFKLIETNAPLDDIKLTRLNEVEINEPITGNLTGGNLALIQTSIGTKWQIDTRNKIVILEDVNEPGYRIDRMLLQLTQSHLLNEAKAIVFGEFTLRDNTDNEEPLLVKYALNNFAHNINIPVFKTECIGHGYNNQPFIIGAEGCIENSNDSYILCYPGI